MTPRTERERRRAPGLRVGLLATAVLLHGPASAAPPPQRPLTLASLQATAGTPLSTGALARLEQDLERTGPQAPERADLLFRLGEHYRALQAQLVGPGPEARRLAQKAIEAYRAIATGHARYPRMDEVLCKLAQLLNQIGQRIPARKVFIRLLRNHPASKHVPQAYLSFAEYFYQQGRYPQALKLYQQVNKYPGAPGYGYAAYMQGWCLLQLKQHTQALERFVTVLRKIDRWPGTARRKRALRSAVKTGAVLAYVQVGAPRKARFFFRRLDAHDVASMLMSLRDAYRRAGMDGKAHLVQRQLATLK